MKTIEEMHREWTSKIKLYDQLILKIPIENKNHKQWLFIKNEQVRSRKMVELIEKYLL